MSAPDLPPPPTFDQPKQRPLALHLHASRVTPEDLRGGVVIVIDAIRASVTICKAMHEGAAKIVPVLTADEARSKAAALHANPSPPSAPGGGSILLGGERAGVLIEGFDLDNSPLSYTRERVAGRTIVFTTSNGTAGLLHARHAARVLVGCICNLTSVCNAVKDDPRPVHILCCGTRGDVSLDDVLAGGAMARQLLAAGREPVTDDSHTLAIAAYDHAMERGMDGLRAAMRGSRGGRNLVRIGLGDDVDYCSAHDTLPVVPEFFPLRGEITLLR
ncbi:MAG TPA: 2-phosphosulfolactate phosphatase [Phycisphaerales bacterium]|nr:2-phosphosulfolactate phosphatase [Phycisphaerales bacterium]